MKVFTFTAPDKHSDYGHWHVVIVAQNLVQARKVLKDHLIQRGHNPERVLAIAKKAALTPNAVIYSDVEGCTKDFVPSKE